MGENHWKQSITRVEPNKLLLKGYRIDELMGKISFADALYLAIRDELPSTGVSELLNAMLVSSVDHGVTPPSTLAALTVASTGADFSSCMAAGVLAISRFHGGAIEDCMKLLREAVERKRAGSRPTAEVAGNIIDEYKSRKKVLPGFGHRIHTSDPRTRKLFKMARDAGAAGEYVEMAEAIGGLTEEKIGKSLPINVDGAMGTLLLELGFPVELANGFFVVSRCVGLMAHIYEEKTREKPMRVVDPKDHEYDGPPERPVP